MVDKKIKDYKVCIVGLGYVGLPLALLAAKKGHQVFGFDVDQRKVELLKQNQSPFTDQEINENLQQHGSLIEFSTNSDIIAKADVIVICVPTPVDKERNPNLQPLESACKTVAEKIQLNSESTPLVIVESTIFPGTMEEVVRPIFKQIVGTDFFLAHCPERIDPGNKHFNLEKIPRVLGAMTATCASKAYQFYTALIDAPVKVLSSVKAAETTKVVENTFRDVNIALVNELAQSFDVMGIDVLEVIDGASTKPFAFMPHFPGCGVGGHCIPVDPYYLIDKSRKNGFNPKFLSMAREINENMPHYTIEKVKRALLEKQKNLENSKILLLGLSYKANVDDMRESPALIIAEELKRRGVDLDIYDPYIPEQSTTADLESGLKDKDCVIVATNHQEFVNISPDLLLKNNVGIIIDGRNCLNKEKMQEAGIIYRGIGR